MRAVLVERVVDVDEQRAQVVDLGGGVRRVRPQRARQLEEVEEERLDEALQLEGVVVVRPVARAGGGAGGVAVGARGVRGREVGYALLLERRELVIELFLSARALLRHNGSVKCPTV